MSRSKTWRNWARLEQATPTRVVAPRSLPELAECVQRAAARGHTVRAVGAGHSFTGAAVAPEVQVRPERLNRILEIDHASGLVTVEAGMTLRRLNELLAAHGLAMENLGDIDKQTVAGAIATGTHGTGARLRGLAAQVHALEVVGSDGQILECSAAEHGNRFQAARLSLGAVGILGTVTLQCVPAFTLRAVEQPMRLAEVLDRLEEFVDGHDHFEFYWWPHTDRVLTKFNDRLGSDRLAADRLASDRVDSVPRPLPRWRYALDDEVLSNGVFEATNRLCSWKPGLTPMVNQVAARALSAREYADASHAVFCSPRRVRFCETEYGVPRDSVIDVLTELRGWIERHDECITFPVEVRFAAADDIWLSTAYQRPTAYIACHQNPQLRRGPYFAQLERVVAPLGGRPHWGKLHTLERDRLTQLYPRFGDFLAERNAADPDRVFANPYTERVLGI